jgi:hypothetical protein
MFYNTTQVLGDELKHCRANVMRQDDIVLAYFRQGGDHTPSEVWQSGILDNAPLTSVRRAITNLTDMGKLEKTTRQRRGIYGKPEFVWRLPATQLDMWS